MTIRSYSLGSAKQTIVTIELPADLVILYTHYYQGETYLYGTSDSPSVTEQRTFYLATTYEEVTNSTYIGTIMDLSENLWHIMEMPI